MSVMTKFDINSERVIIIDKWYRRLGNNILQLHNAILIGLYFNCNVIIPGHSFFNTKLIKINSVNSSNNINKIVKITHPNNYFDYDIIKFLKKILLNDNLLKNLVSFDAVMFSKHYLESLRIMRTCFVVQNECIKPLGDNDILIHIRSGDVFRDGGRVHGRYYQPPLCFYLSILDKKFDNVYLVAEDTKNPCINALLKLFPDIKYNQNNLTEDIKLILSAKHVVGSRGTFVSSLLKLSNNIVHTYNYNYDEKYLKIMNPWRNNEKQRETMLDFKTPDKSSCYKIRVFDKSHRDL